MVMLMIVMMMMMMMMMQAPRSSPLGLACELDPSSRCLVMCFDKLEVDANMMNFKVGSRAERERGCRHLYRTSPASESSENNALYLNI